MFGLYFAPSIPDTYDAVMACDKERFNRFFHAMLDAGVYFAPSAFEAGFVSAAHSADDIAATLALAAKAFAATALSARRSRSPIARRSNASGMGDTRGAERRATATVRRNKRTQSLDSSG